MALETGLDEETALNRSLDDVIRLLEREIERLKTSLEVFRLSEHPQRQDIIRWHVRALDERQDALEDMKRLLAVDTTTASTHESRDR